MKELFQILQTGKFRMLSSLLSSVTSALVVVRSFVIAIIITTNMETTIGVLVVRRGTLKVLLLYNLMQVNGNTILVELEDIFIGVQKHCKDIMRML
jgi:hypothetical protein